jgi:hypothetical protein
MRRFLALFALAVAAIDLLGSAAPPRDAHACGSADVASLGALDPVDAIVGRMSTINDDWDYKDREELRFLEPFRREHPRELAELWALSYAGTPPAAIPTTELDRALASKDAAAARKAGERFVTAWLALPPVPASQQKLDLVRAAGAIDATAATELFAVEQAIVRGIPDGWRADVQKKFSPAAARALDQRVDTWVAKHRGHPLQSYAELWKVRTAYFSGDDARAWDVIFAAPPPLRVRALAEARYLLMLGVRPTSAQLEARSDAAWIAGLLDRSATPVDDARFAKWWRVAETAPARKAALNLEERLLHAIAMRPQLGKLPPSFPKDAKAPSAFWAQMRAAALIRSGDTAGALTQLAMLPAKDPARPELEASAHLAAKRPERAAQVAGLGADERNYLLAVLVTTPDLEKLAKEPGAMGVVPRLELGLRTGAQGDWKKAASIVDKDDPIRAKGWRKLAELRAAKGGRAGLELARFLDAKAGVLFDQPGRPYYRAISYRHEPQERPVEARAIEAAMQRNTERYPSLVAYVDWLEKNPADPEAKVAITEADAVYNRLVNYSGDDLLVWGRTLPKSELAKRLRAAGKAVRATR